MKKIKILLVEDDKLDVIDVTRALDRLNIYYDLLTAKNGVQALDLLEALLLQGVSELPDVLLIDINMPKMNGFELLEAIRTKEQLKELKCFIITSSTEKVDRAAAEKLKVSGYIVKPLKLNSPSTMDAFNLLIDLKNLNTRI